MTQIVGNEVDQDPRKQEPAKHGERAEHGHSGEGAASALAHLLSQGEKHRRQNGDTENGKGRS